MPYYDCALKGRLTTISTFDPYPMPRVDNLYGQVGLCLISDHIDHLSGVLARSSVRGDKTPDSALNTLGFYQYTVMPLGLN